MRLVISESGSGSRDEIVPLIVSAWSAPFGGTKEVEKIVERRIRGGDGDGEEVRVWEETGNSIALHVWFVALYFKERVESLLINDDIQGRGACVCGVFPTRTGRSEWLDGFSTGGFWAGYRGVSIGSSSDRVRNGLWCCGDQSRSDATE